MTQVAHPAAPRRIQGAGRAELAASCDEDPEIAREQRYQLRVPGYTGFRETLATDNPDLVVVTVPHHARRQVIEEAAGHRVHVLNGKPFATNADEARELAGTCEQAGIQLMVTPQRRSNPIYTSFVQLADRIGTPFVVDAQYTLRVPDPSEGWRCTAAREQAGASSAWATT
jgi:predicted dehydrogenase